MGSRGQWADRWRTETGWKLGGQAAARLIDGLPLDDLGLGEHNGRVDLRGLPLSAALYRWELHTPGARRHGDLLEIHGSTLAGIDLSGALLPNLRMFDTRVVDCRFDGANCEDLRLWGTTFIDCSFWQASLYRATLGSGCRNGSQNTWYRVDFSRADIREAGLLVGVFVDCDFSYAKLAKLMFRQCELTGCRFAGTLREVIFYGSASVDAPESPPFRGLDLSKVRFEDTGFRDCELIDPVLPADSEVVLIRRFPCAASRALAELADDASDAADELRRILRSELNGPSMRPESVFLLNDRDLRGYPSGQALVDLAREVLLRCERACLAEAASSR